MSDDMSRPAKISPADAGPAEISHPDLDGGQVALIAALMELERYLRASGWDQPPRLFALVPTDDLLASEPQLGESLGLLGSRQGAPRDSLTAIEQEQFEPSESLLDDLEAVEWPPTVFGCAVSVERTFLPARFEPDIPDDPAEAARFVASHPDRQEVRVLVGVDRAGHQHGVARVISQPEELLAADNLVPGLTLALAHTLT